MQQTTSEEISNKLKTNNRSVFWLLLLSTPIFVFTGWELAHAATAQDWALVMGPITSLAMVGYFGLAFQERAHLHRQLSRLDAD